MPVRSLDEHTLATRVGEVLSPRFGPVEVAGVAPLPGGTSSLTYVADVAGPRELGGRVVVKVAPAGLDPVGNRDVLRQSRVLRVLGGQPGVAVPAVLGEDGGAPPEVPPLFLMAFVEGESVEPLHDPPAAVRGALPNVTARALAAVDMLGALQRAPVDVLGEATVTLEAEIERWEHAFGTVDEELARPGASCAVALHRSVPAADGPVVVHGDYRLGNMLARGKKIAAIIDWEVWSIGDPRLDVAWFLNMVDPSHPGVVGRCDDLPAQADLIAAYESGTGRGAVDLAWFLSLVRYRQAAMSALIGKHARRRPEPDPRALEIEGWVLPLLSSVLDDLT
jgi:aminoglycoside phosphotransferase (APT) family kinase protein